MGVVLTKGGNVERVKWQKRGKNIGTCWNARLEKRRGAKQGLCNTCTSGKSISSGPFSLSSQLTSMLCLQAATEGRLCKHATFMYLLTCLCVLKGNWAIGDNSAPYFFPSTSCDCPWGLMLVFLWWQHLQGLGWRYCQTDYFVCLLPSGEKHMEVSVKFTVHKRN